MASPRHDRRQSAVGRINTFRQLFGVEPTHRVLDHDKLRFKLARPGLCQNERGECLRRNDVGCYATLFEFNAVMETPRRTGASISERK